MAADVRPGNPPRPPLHFISCDTSEFVSDLSLMATRSSDDDGTEGQHPKLLQFQDSEFRQFSSQLRIWDFAIILCGHKTLSPSHNKLILNLKQVLIEDVLTLKSQPAIHLKNRDWFNSLSSFPSFLHYSHF
ncbi:hypothetical protein TorRG33x02_163320 [Trema orientale]|uniref:Uncharacterized protein n=1 Tax=Trema orientale TaxID=63057 RepID=A0A2P5EQY7_TREOI|nr:hypothetical protein TorRG33x02_163320 [Trema orientale]